MSYADQKKKSVFSLIQQVQYSGLWWSRWLLKKGNYRYLNK